MKKIKLFLCTSFAAFVLGVTLTFTPPATAVTTSAANCSAANLAQALLGIGMSQDGIVNNSLDALFIVCSVDYLNPGGPMKPVGCCGGPLPPPDLFDVFVEGVFPPVASDEEIRCIYRSGFFGAPGFFSAAFAINQGIDSSIFPPQAIATVRGYTSVNENIPGEIPIGGVGPNNTVVCALDPNEGIASVATTPFFFGPF